MERRNTIRDVNIDMFAHKENYPSMYEDILGVLIEEAEQNFRIIDVDAIKAAASKIKHVTFEITMRLDLDVIIADVIFEDAINDDDIYDALSFAYIADVDILEDTRKEMSSRIRIYQYILDQAGLDIHSFEDVERLIVGEVSQ